MRAGRAIAIVMLSVALAGCGGEPRGGEGSLPGPVPSGVSYEAADPSSPPAPGFSLELVDGTPITGAELWERRAVVLAFFASWCTTCAEQQADLTALAERYGDSVAFLGIAGEDEPEALAAYLDEHEVAYAVALDDDLAVWRSYAVREPPQVVVIAKGGRVVRGWPGGASRALIVETLDSLVTRGG